MADYPVAEHQLLEHVLNGETSKARQYVRKGFAEGEPVWVMHELAVFRSQVAEMADVLDVEMQRRKPAK